MKDEIATITLKTFVKERLKGNIDSIIDYDLGCCVRISNMVVLGVRLTPMTQI